jgi:hypothetical protein
MYSQNFSFFKEMSKCFACGQNGEIWFDDVPFSRRLCRSCYKRAGRSSDLCDGITYKVLGPHGISYFAKCAYLTGGKRCSFTCLAFDKKFMNSPPRFYCLENDDIEMFNRLVRKGIFIAC